MIPQKKEIARQLSQKLAKWQIAKFGKIDNTVKLVMSK